jgi:hypothetical protein
MPDEKNTPRADQPIYRSLTTDVAIAVAPALAVVTNHLLKDKPKEPPRPQESAKEE